MQKMNDAFLAIDKNLFKLGLNPTEILIIAQIAEYQRNTGDCFISNETLATQFGVSVSTIKRELDKLEKEGYIVRNTKNKQVGKERHLTVNFARLKMNLPQGSNCTLRKEQNEPVKDNIKRKDLKDNYTAQSLSKTVPTEVCESRQQANSSLLERQNQQQVANLSAQPEGEVIEKEEIVVNKVINLKDIKGIEGVNYWFIAADVIETATGIKFRVIKE